MCSGRQHLIVQVVKSLPPVWETYQESLAPSLSLTHPQLLWLYGEQTSRSNAAFLYQGLRNVKRVAKCRREWICWWDWEVLLSQVNPWLILLAKQREQMWSKDGEEVATRDWYTLLLRIWRFFPHCPHILYPSKEASDSCKRCSQPSISVCMEDFPWKHLKP